MIYRARAHRAGSLQGVDPVHRVSILPRGVAALGYTLQLPTEDRYLMTRTELLNRLKVLLGGRVAEEIIFKEISTGAQNDLERATAIARSMVTEYGMSSKLGPLYYAKEKRGVFVGLDFSGEPHSERVASEIDEEVRTIIENAYQEVTGLLTDKKPKLETLAQMLLEKEMVEGAELEALLNGKLPEVPTAMDWRNNRLKPRVVISTQYFETLAGTPERQNFPPMAINGYSRNILRRGRCR
jgi:cell division protease FtsH